MVKNFLNKKRGSVSFGIGMMLSMILVIFGVVLAAMFIMNVDMSSFFNELPDFPTVNESEMEEKVFFNCDYLVGYTNYKDRIVFADKVMIWACDDSVEKCNGSSNFEETNLRIIEDKIEIGGHKIGSFDGEILDLNTDYGFKLRKKIISKEGLGFFPESQLLEKLDGSKFNAGVFCKNSEDLKDENSVNLCVPGENIDEKSFEVEEKCVCKPDKDKLEIIQNLGADKNEDVSDRITYPIVKSANDNIEECDEGQFCFFGGGCKEEGIGSSNWIFVSHRNSWYSWGKDAVGFRWDENEGPQAKIYQNDIDLLSPDRVINMDSGSTPEIDLQEITSGDQITKLDYKFRLDIRKISSSENRLDFVEELVRVIKSDDKIDLMKREKGKSPKSYFANTVNKEMINYLLFDSIELPSE